MWIYLLKFSALLAIFLVFYKVFLEQATMHQFKRFYLLGAFLIALSIPAITFTEYVLVEPQPLNTEIVQAYTSQGNSIPLEAPINYVPWLLWSIYGLGVLLFSFKFLINLTGVIRRIKNNPKEKSGPFLHVLLKDPIAPHTFFSYVFFNKKKYRSHQIPKEVFWHEETHAQQKHSLDVLLLELLQILLWFHPLVYIAKHFIKLNHEFLADEAVLNKGVSTSTYQKILLAFASSITEPSLSNSINYSSIKKRIIIMKTHTSKKALWGKRLLLLPVLALLLYSFSNKEIVVLEQQTTAQQTTTQSKKAMEIPTVNTEIIEVLINRNGQILVDSHLVKLEELSTFLLRYNEGLTKEQRSQTVPSIITIDKEAPKKVIQEVEAILSDYGVATINIQERMYSQQEKRATKAEIKEYNALAGQKVIKKSDMPRLKQLYDRMTLEHKAAAEPYPNFPPPPPPAKAPKIPNERVEASRKIKKIIEEQDTYDTNNISINQPSRATKGEKSSIPVPPAAETPTTPRVIKNSDLPPPPPIPANAPEADRIEYEKTVKNYKKGNPGLVYEHKNEAGEMIEVVVITDESNVAPPMPPSPPSKHLAELAEQGATFYLNGSPISSDEAIKMVKKNKDINIDITGGESDQAIVKLITKSKKN